MAVILPVYLQDPLRTFPETHMAVNVVTITLTDGRVFPQVEVAWASEIIRVHGYEQVPFTGEEISDVEDASGIS